MAAPLLGQGAPESYSPPLQELGVLSHADYKITCMLDHAAMVTVQTEKYGVFDCKPLAFIWAKFPGQYNESNTVMLDDLR